MNKEKLIRLIELIFDNHCSIKEVSYQQDELVCDNLDELKKDIINNICLFLDIIE